MLFQSQVKQSIYFCQHDITDVCPIFLGDIRKDEDIHSALKLCTDDEGKPKLNVLINCAGVSNAFKTYNFSTNKPQRLQDFRDLTEINIIGTFNVIRLSVPLLAENPTNESGMHLQILSLVPSLTYCLISYCHRYESCNYQHL